MLKVQVSRFAIVGFVSTAIDFALYFVLLGLGVGAPLAKGAGYLAGLTNSYVGNTVFAFGARERIGSPVLMARFAAVYGVSLGANVGVNQVFVPLIGPASVLPALAVSICITFLGLKFLVYRSAS